MCDVQWPLRSVRRELAKRQEHGRPSGWGVEALPVGFPGAPDVGGAQVQVVDLVVPEDVHLDPCPVSRIYFATGIAEIDRDLQEPAIVFEADSALHSDRIATTDDLTLRANKSETIEWLKFTLEGVGERTHGYAFEDTAF